MGVDARENERAGAVILRVRRACCEGAGLAGGGISEGGALLVASGGNPTVALLTVERL